MERRSLEVLRLAARQGQFLPRGKTPKLPQKNAFFDAPAQRCSASSFRNVCRYPSIRRYAPTKAHTPACFDKKTGFA